MLWTFLLTDWHKWNYYPVTLASRRACENASTVSGFFTPYCSFCDVYYNCSWFVLPKNNNMLIMQPMLITISVVLSGDVDYRGVNRRSVNCRRCEPSSVWTVVDVNCRRCEPSSVWTVVGVNRRRCERVGVNRRGVNRRGVNSRPTKEIIYAKRMI